MTVNYISLGKGFFKRKYYAYADTKDHLAGHLFLEAGIKVNFKSEFIKEEDCLVIVVCSIKEKDEETFLKCLDQLRNNIEIYSWRNEYKQLCEFLNERFG